MGRFVLLSAVLHLSVLAALGSGTIRPQLPTSKLSVTLNEPAGVMAEPVRRNAAHRTLEKSAAKTAGTNIKRFVQAGHSPGALREIPRNPVSAPLARIAGNSETKVRIDDPGGNRSVSLTTQQSRAPLTGKEAVRQVQRKISAGTSRQSDATMLASQIKGQLRSALAPYFSYPLMARRNGWEGRVQVGLRVEADGHLSHVRIARSSGYRLLDSAALATLNHVDMLPQAAGWLDGRHFDMVLPIEYRLIDGRS